MKERYFYICDRKHIECTGDIDGVKECKNTFCRHTSKMRHAKYLNEPGRKFAIVKHSEDETAFFEIVGACAHPLIKCEYQFEVSEIDTKLCTAKDCPAWQLRE